MIYKNLKYTNNITVQFRYLLFYMKPDTVSIIMAGIIENLPLYSIIIVKFKVWEIKTMYKTIVSRISSQILTIML